MPESTAAPTRASFHALAPEMVAQVFDSLDHVGSATSLASTCHYMHSIWLDNGSRQCEKLVWAHTLLCEYARPNHDEDEQVPEGETLVDRAKQLERLRPGECSLLPTL
jgi:hypothetical protein